jgi:hypothetical protein
MPTRPSPLALQPGQVLSQYGARPPTFTGQTQPQFHTAPRTHERGVSVVAGRLTRREVAMIVRQEFISWRDFVRYTTVGRLRDAGFRVRSTPNRMNPNHVSVEYDGEWTDDGDVAKRFDDCFDQFTGGGGGGHG